jgi:hypothetical protein
LRSALPAALAPAVLHDLELLLQTRASTTRSASRADLGAVDSSLSRWVLRLLVLSAFGLTLWLCGPRAAAVLAMKLEDSARNSPLVVLDRIGIAERPAWLDQSLLLAVARDLAPWLGDELPILDEAGCRRLRDGLASVPWVERVGFERVFPNRFRLQLELRQPILAVLAADGMPLCLVDAAGLVLPWVDTALPRTWLLPEGGGGTLSPVAGEPVRDPRVVAAAAIVREWREALQPAVPGCPELLEVDANNLGERWQRGRRFPEIRVKLRASDGSAVVLAYGRPVDSVQPRVPVATKAAVLRQLLAAHPGLHGVTAADLRFANRWADYIEPRAAGRPDPDGPWSLLDQPPVHDLPVRDR